MLTKRAPADACSTFETSMSGGDRHRFETRQDGLVRSSRDGAWRAIARRPGNCGDVQGSRPATAADDVDEAAVDPLADLRRGFLSSLVIFAKLIRKAGVRIRHDQRVRDCRQGC